MAACLQNLAGRKLTFTTSGRYALPETNSSHLKIGGWAVVGKMTFPLGRPIFGTFASFREGNDLKKEVMVCSDAYQQYRDISFAEIHTHSPVDAFIPSGNHIQRANHTANLCTNLPSTVTILIDPSELHINHENGISSAQPATNFRIIIGIGTVVGKWMWIWCRRIHMCVDDMSKFEESQISPNQPKQKPSDSIRLNLSLVSSINILKTHIILANKQWQRGCNVLSSHNSLVSKTTTWQRACCRVNMTAKKSPQSLATWKNEVKIPYKTRKTKDQSASKQLPFHWRVRLQDHHNSASKNAALLLFDLQGGLCEFCYGWEQNQLHNDIAEHGTF